MEGPLFEEGFVGATIAADEGAASGDAFDASAYSFFGGGGDLDGGLDEELEVGLEAPPAEEEVLEGGIDYMDAAFEEDGDDEDLSMAALISGTDGRGLAPPAPPPIPSAELTAGGGGLGAAEADGLLAPSKPSGSIALGGLLTAGSGFYAPSPPGRTYGGRPVIGADLGTFGTPPLGGLPSEPDSLSRLGRPERALPVALPGAAASAYPGYGQPPQPQLYPPAPAGLSASQLEAALLARSAPLPPVQMPPQAQMPPQMHQGHSAPGIMLGPVRSGTRPQGAPGLGSAPTLGPPGRAPAPQFPHGVSTAPGGIMAPPAGPETAGLLPPGPGMPAQAAVPPSAAGVPQARRTPGVAGPAGWVGPPGPRAGGPPAALDQQDFPALGTERPAGPPRAQGQPDRPTGMMHPEHRRPHQQPPQRRGIGDRLHGLSLADRLPAPGAHGRTRTVRRDSVYMSADEIDGILYSQMRGLQQGPPYVEDYYYQGFVYKYYNRRNRASFAPETVRELAPTEKAGAGEVEFVHLEGLGRVPFSNIRRPRPLMEQTTTGSGPAGEDGAVPDQEEKENDGGNAQGPRRRLGDEPALAARIMIEDCSALVLDVLDIDAIFVAGAGRTVPDEDALRARRGLLLDGLAASLRLAASPDGAGADGSTVTAAVNTDPVFRRLMALPKGRTLAARALRVTFPPADERVRPQPRPRSTANLRLLWAVLRGAHVLFDVGSSGDEGAVAAQQSASELVASSARVAAAAAGVVSALPSASDVAGAAAALAGGMDAGKLPPLTARPKDAATPDGAPLPPLPWLADVIVALARRARELRLLEDNEEIEEGELERAAPEPEPELAAAKDVWRRAAAALAAALATQREGMPANLVQAIGPLLP